MNKQIDYLMVGHVTQDVLSDGKLALGGTVYYSSLSAQILGLKVGITTSIEASVDLSEFMDIPIACKESKTTTMFENRYTKQGRIQHLHNRAQNLTIDDIPKAWRSTPIVHLGPIAREIDVKIASSLNKSFIGITPQGWLRKWDENGLVSFSEWNEASSVLPEVDAVVLSIEDIAGNWSIIDKWKNYAKVLAVTLGDEGAAIYYGGNRIKLDAPKVNEVDPTGAGDVFASAFFIQLFNTNDPISAGEFAVSVASSSVEDFGLKGLKIKNHTDIAV